MTKHYFNHMMTVWYT